VVSVTGNEESGELRRGASAADLFQRPRRNSLVRSQSFQSRGEGGNKNRGTSLARDENDNEGGGRRLKRGSSMVIRRGRDKDEDDERGRGGHRV
jgi:hypothetical protein